jgi:hypothetical protein
MRSLAIICTFLHSCSITDDGKGFLAGLAGGLDIGVVVMATVELIGEHQLLHISGVRARHLDLISSGSFSTYLPLETS